MGHRGSVRASCEWDIGDLSELAVNETWGICQS